MPIWSDGVSLRIFWSIVGAPNKFLQVQDAGISNYNNFLAIANTENDVYTGRMQLFKYAQLQFRTDSVAATRGIRLTGFYVNGGMRE